MYHPQSTVKIVKKYCLKDLLVKLHYCSFACNRVKKACFYSDSFCSVGPKLCEIHCWCKVMKYAEWFEECIYINKI